MILFRLISALILSLGIFIFAIYTSNQKEVRYQIGYGPCLNNIINNSPKKIDLAGIGGSRMLALLMPNETMDISLSAIGKEIEVVNFAKSWFGPDYEYQLLQDIYKSGIKIDNLLIQFESHRKGSFHPHGYSFLKSQNIIDSVFNSELNSTIDGLSFLIQSHLHKARDIVFNSQHRKRFERLNGQKFKNQRTCYPKDYKINQKKLSAAKKKFLTHGFKDEKFDLHETKFAYFINHYKKMVDLAKKNGTNVFLIRVPKINYGTIISEDSKSIEEHFNVGLIKFPIEIRQEIYEDGYRDGSHINSSGRALVTPWLLKEVYNSPLSK